MSNVELRAMNVYEWAEPDTYDLVYCRNFLQHLSRPPDVLRCMWSAVRYGGAVVVEDADFEGSFCDPPNDGFDFWVEALSAGSAAARRGSTTRPKAAPVLPPGRNSRARADRRPTGRSRWRGQDVAPFHDRGHRRSDHRGGNRLRRSDTGSAGEPDRVRCGHGFGLRITAPLPGLVPPRGCLTPRPPEGSSPVCTARGIPPRAACRASGSPEDGELRRPGRW